MIIRGLKDGRLKMPYKCSSWFKSLPVDDSLSNRLHEISAFKVFTALKNFVDVWVLNASPHIKILEFYPYDGRFYVTGIELDIIRTRLVILSSNPVWIGK